MWYLIIDSCNDSCSNPHTNDEATMEVLMKEQGLNNGIQEEKDSIDIAMPIRITLAFGEVNHQPVSESI